MGARRHGQERALGLRWKRSPDSLQLQLALLARTKRTEVVATRSTRFTGAKYTLIVMWPPCTTLPHTPACTTLGELTALPQTP